MIVSLPTPVGSRFPEEGWLAFLFVMLILAPFAALFVLVRRHQKSEPWQRFGVYCICAIVGGFLSLLVGNLMFSFMLPVYEAYLHYVTDLLYRLGYPGMASTFLTLFSNLMGILLWYPGMGLAVWFVWRWQFSGRGGSEGSRVHDP